MIVYQNTKKGFLEDFINDTLINLLKTLTKEIINVTPSPSEIRAWENSLKEMFVVLSDSSIDENILIAIEYQIPATSKRIDFLVIDDKKMAIIELKQWQKIEKTDMEDVVITFLGKNKRETIHPSYQAYSYARFIKDFNLFARKLEIIPCVYMHNMEENEVFNSYKIVSETKVFFKNQRKDLIKFISTFKPSKDVLEKLDSSALAPSKSLINSLKSMLEGNEEFVLLDEQKVVFEKALSLAKKSNNKNKKVYIVKGGPGSGKSVVAVNLLVEFIKNKKQARYVSKNSAVREVNLSKLKGKKLEGVSVNMLFVSSGSFIGAVKNEYDVLIVDEAHRLNEKSGIFGNMGENQVKEIINAAKLSVFFIDEDQKVTFKDIGSIEEIKKWAKHFGAEIYEDELKSQFRCNGSDGYIAWLDDVLEIRESANKTLEGIDYDFKVFDDVNEMYEELKKKENSAIVAGYCWDWVSKKENRDDIIIGNFSKKWNLNEDKGLWLLKNPLNQVGCIHTIQGLECDYIGVIIGDDLVYDNGIKTQPEKRAKTDKSLNGYKKMLKSNPKKAEKLADKIIKNTYRVLMSRGLKGCYVYATDEKLRKYLKGRI